MCKSWALLKSWSSKLHSTQYSAPFLEFTVSDITIIMSYGSIDSFERAARLVEIGNFWDKSIDQSTLKGQDKQQIGFFVIRFTVKYSDRLVATAALKVLDFQFLRVLRNVRLSPRLCKILVQFVTFMLFSGHLGICFTVPTAAVFAF